jgi:hypothetical protein
MHVYLNTSCLFVDFIVTKHQCDYCLQRYETFRFFPRIYSVGRQILHKRRCKIFYISHCVELQVFTIFRIPLDRLHCTRTLKFTIVHCTLLVCIKTLLGMYMQR